nr:MAG TPA: hypothetical protein [Caudoviricetes sp.]
MFPNIHLVNWFVYEVSTQNILILITFQKSLSVSTVSTESL